MGLGDFETAWRNSYLDAQSTKLIGYPEQDEVVEEQIPSSLVLRSQDHDDPEADTDDASSHAFSAFSYVNDQNCDKVDVVDNDHESLAFDVDTNVSSLDNTSTLFPTDDDAGENDTSHGGDGHAYSIGGEDADAHVLSDDKYDGNDGNCDGNGHVFSAFPDGDHDVGGGRDNSAVDENNDSHVCHAFSPSDLVTNVHDSNHTLFLPYSKDEVGNNHDDSMFPAFQDVNDQDHGVYGGANCVFSALPEIIHVAYNEDGHDYAFSAFVSDTSISYLDHGLFLLDINDSGGDGIDHKGDSYGDIFSTVYDKCSDARTDHAWCTPNICFLAGE